MQKPVRPGCSGVLRLFPFNFLPLGFTPYCFRVISVALFFFIAGGAVAQEPPPDEPLTILITASRFAETADETLAPVTVITRQDIEEKQAATVEEVLRAVPGITLSNSGGAGKLTSLFLRGTESNHVLVLIDGVKVGNATSGTTPFEHLPLAQIEKIEVVRGPRSSLYGSEAIGGVIQIFTRRGQSETRPAFSVGAGSHNTRRFNVGVSGGAAAAWYNFGLSAYKTDGYNACLGRASVGMFGDPDYVPGAGCFADEPDDDGHKNKAVSIRGGVSLTDALAIEGNFLNSDSETMFDGSFQNESETTTRVSSVKATFQASAQWKSSLLISRSQDESDSFKDGEFRTTFDTTREQINWQNNFRLNENSQIVAGVDYLDDEVGGTTNYNIDSRDNTGVFGLLRTEIDANDLEVSLREDDNEQFGDKTTGSVGWGRNLGDGNRVTASYGTAFTTPTFNDLYSPPAPNPDLDPEKSKSFDFGLSQTGSNGRWAVNLYQTKIDDFIALDETQNYKAFNIDKAKITGLELSGGVTAGQWDVSANLTLQKPKDASGEHNGNLLVRRPKQIIQLAAARKIGKHSIGASLRNQDRSFDDAANAREIDGFTVVDVRGEIRAHRHWSLGLKVNNLFDRKYETVSYYPQDEINFMATLRYVP